MFLILLKIYWGEMMKAGIELSTKMIAILIIGFIFLFIAVFVSGIIPMDLGGKIFEKLENLLTIETG